MHILVLAHTNILSDCTHSPSYHWYDYFTLAGIIGIISVIIALWTYVKNTKASIAHTKASIILQCLQRYLGIYEYRTQAIINNEAETARQYWRALIDLLWTEYHLWKNKYINDDTMEIWCMVRRQEYNNRESAISINLDNQSSEIISYKDVWTNLLNSNYFPAGDSFRDFLEEIHSSEQNVMTVLKKYRK